ncbi:MAG: ABC transporter permease [Chloroflexota bacterium]|nr:ABC transporter permease [Chloroflexota bacterium]
MTLLTSVWDFIRDNQDRFNDLLFSHVRLSASALIIAVFLYVPLGVAFSRLDRIGSPAVGALASLRVIPSLALVFIFVPWLGFGYRPALLALVLLAAPPIVLNTFAGVRNVDASVIEAAQGLGMNQAQVFTRIQLPLAFPVMLAGVRSASVEIVASATLASLIGVQTLGQYIFTGISLLDTTYLLAGGLPIVMLVLVVEVFFGGIERIATPATR